MGDIEIVPAGWCAVFLACGVVAGECVWHPRRGTYWKQLS